jgi:hypothetical protein
MYICYEAGNLKECFEKYKGVEIEKAEESNLLSGDRECQ